MTGPVQVARGERKANLHGNSISQSQNIEDVKRIALYTLRPKT
jgi:hypothetical protein